MARRRRRGQQMVSLFPFLNVLVAVIGTLILLIAGLSLIRIAEAAVPPEVRQEHLRQEIEEGRAQLSDLEALIAEAEGVLRQLKAARAELERLDLQGRQQRTRGRARADLLAEADRLQRRIGELERELAELRRQVEALRRQLEQDPPDDPASTPIVLLRGRAGGGDVDPFFIECTGQALLLHRQPGKPPARVRKGDVENSTELRELFREVSSKSAARVIFLIRPDGVPVYDAAARWASREQVQHGKLPLPGKGAIDWGGFVPEAG